MVYNPGDLPVQCQGVYGMATAKKSAAKKVTKKPVAKKSAAKSAVKKAVPVKKAAPAKKAVKAKVKTARKPNAGFMKPMTPSSALAAVIGAAPQPRTEVTKKI